MSRKFALIIIVAVLLAGGLAAGLLYWSNKSYVGPPLSDAQVYATKVKLGFAPPPVQSAPVAIPWEETVRLAIGGLGFPDDAEDQRLGDLITAQLTSSRGLEMVERQELDAVLREEQLNLSGLVRAKDAVRAGKLLRADWFLLGTVAQINKTNCLVVRLVDARTGITRDGAVFVESAMPALAIDVARFVRQQRQIAAEAKPRIYLAIGSFADLSVNNRQAEFPRQLRGYLTAAYQHSRFTLLEREYADILLQEMELDLAGLTDEGGTNIPTPMQSAFWLVDGCYQSYETTNLEVELTLNVHRIFSTTKHVTLRGLPGEPVCRQVKQAIDNIVNQNTGIVIPTRMSEVRSQMAAAKELTQSGTQIWRLITPNDNLNDDPVQLRNIEEAIKALDTVMLLDPTNREAKVYLAACFCTPGIGRLAEARDLYCEILEEPVHDSWANAARQALVNSFDRSSPEERARWFASAIRNNTNSTLDEFYRQNATLAARDVAIENRGEKAGQLAEQRLIEAIRSCKKFMDGKGATFFGGYGLYDFQDAFQDKVTAAREMAHYLPQLESEFPELAPHLAAEVLYFQTDTNSPVLAEYQKQLEWCLAHTNQIYKPKQFWASARYSAFVWLFAHQQYALAVRTMEGFRAAADPKSAQDIISSEDQIAMGYAYMGAGRWRAALKIFATFSNTPVLMATDGPWGRGWHPVLTDKEADFCRQKLGLPITHDPREFEMGKACFCLCTPSAFAVDDRGVWIGMANKLIQLDFNLRTNFEVTLPKDSATAVTSLCVGSSAVWIGTAGDGLIEFDKATRKVRRLTEKDGLLMDSILSLDLGENALWIGYGSQSRGGLGRLDLTTRHIASFSISLTNVMTQHVSDGRSESIGEAPRVPVTAVAGRTAEEVWFLTQSDQVRHYRIRDDVWEAVGQGFYAASLAADSERLVVGGSYPSHDHDRLLGARILNFDNGQWRDVQSADRLPSGTASAVAIDGRDLWVGGMGYIALVDADQGTVRKFAYVPSRSVDRIQIGGGYVWAQYDCQLHRASLGDVQ
jgi:Curli production assembly/transport component CsgG